MDQFLLKVGDIVIDPKLIKSLSFHTEDDIPVNLPDVYQRIEIVQKTDDE